LKNDHPEKSASSSTSSAELVRSMDWSRTPLGAMEGWPRSLRAVVEMVLGHPVPMVVLWGPEFVQIYNDGYAAIAGSKHPAALGVSNLECWPEARHITEPLYRRVVDRGESFVIKDQLFRLGRNGGGAVEDAYLTVSYSPLRDDEGRIGGVVATVFETTDRVRAERARTTAEARQSHLLRAVEAERSRLADVFMQSPAFMCVLRGPGHVFEMANARYFQLLGGRDLIGRPIREAVPEAGGQGFFELLDRVYETGEAFVGKEVRVRIERGPGREPDEHYLDFVYQATRGPDGEVDGIFVHGVDVTDHVRAREAAERSQSRLQFVLQAGEIGVWDLDLATMRTWRSPRHDEILGYGSLQEEWGYERFLAHVHEEDREAVDALIREAGESGQEFTFECRVVRHGDGAERWVYVHGSPVADAASGRVVRMVGQITDVTERVEAEVELTRARDAAEEANRAKDQFLAVLSHELRTPLTPVVMTVAALEQSPELPEKLRDDLAMVRRNVELESKLIDDLLDLSRVSTGKLRLHTQHVAVHDLVRHVADSCRSETFGKRLNFRAELGAGAEQVVADPARLQQVIWNLVRNAIKFTPEQGTVTLRTRNEPGAIAGGRPAVVIEVEDTGIGIDPEVLPRVFDAFEQGDPRLTRQFGGLGLGLAIAKALVDLHGGTIRACSAGKGRGATFTVSLPTVAGAEVARKPQAPAARGAGAGEAVKVLLVEDHADTRRILARLLQASGYRVETAETAAGALDLAAAGRFDVMVSDIGLPDATGYELMRAIRERHGIPGVALSGYGMEEDVRRGREAGFVDHVVKPVNLQQLESVLARVTGREK
jgi:PAS domain S-box-containing protein